MASRLLCRIPHPIAPSDSRHRCLPFQCHFPSRYRTHFITHNNITQKKQPQCSFFPFFCTSIPFILILYVYLPSRYRLITQTHLIYFPFRERCQCASYFAALSYRPCLYFSNVALHLTMIPSVSSHSTLSRCTCVVSILKETKTIETTLLVRLRAVTASITTHHSSFSKHIHPSLAFPQSCPLRLLGSHNKSPFPPHCEYFLLTPFCIFVRI